MRMQLWFIVHVECQRLKMIMIWWHVQVVESPSTIISVLKFQIYAPCKRNGCATIVLRSNFSCIECCMCFHFLINIQCRHLLLGYLIWYVNH